MKKSLLVIEDDQLFCSLLKRHLEEEYDVAAFPVAEDAVKYLGEHRVDVVLSDLYMPESDGFAILDLVKSGHPGTDVIIMTAYAKIDNAIEAMKKGACDYIAKPFGMEELSLRLKNIFEKRDLLEENVNLRSLIDAQYRPENMIGDSEEMQEVYRLIERISQTDSTTVLITGESGTGKELVAKAIHVLSARKDNKMVSLNCTAIPETLLESELFGYAKGAFTGAGGDKKGLLEYADGGTVFLDEIGDAPLLIQAKLLRFLQEQKFRSVGSNKEITVNVRVICATNQDMQKMIGEGKFREDLYYRINVVTLHMPPLRERKGDIPLYISHFLAGRKKIHPAAVGMLCQYEWPGNVRELRNFIERLVTFTDSDVITADVLPPEISSVPGMLENHDLTYNEAKKKILDEFNVTIINQTLLKCQGNVTKAASDLGLDRANFQRLMRKYLISSKSYKETGAESE